MNELRERLDEFYSTAKGYESFEQPHQKPQFWDPIVVEIRACVERSGRCRVLEFGAGRTLFPGYLGELRPQVTFHAQDVARQNAAFLAEVADSVHIGDINRMDGPYDVIFSTFVWEHLTNPSATLNHLLRILNPGGSLFLVSPRYDFPFYVSPSVRNRSRVRRVLIALGVLARRAGVVLGGRPSFLIDTSPAVLSEPWFRDSDAVHWVSAFDLRRSLPRDMSMTSLKLPSPSLRYWFWSRALLLFVRITKTERRKP